MGHYGRCECSAEFENPNFLNFWQNLDKYKKKRDDYRYKHYGIKPIHADVTAVGNFKTKNFSYIMENQQSNPLILR